MKRKHTKKGISDHPDCPSDDRCNPEQMRGTLALQGGEEVRKCRDLALSHLQTVD
ncbi:MAG: hypothetical protein RXS19_01460 [Caldisphaera sp.]